MKKLFIAILFPIMCKSQAHLGATETEIRQMHPDNEFSRSWTNDGRKYIMSKMTYGTFIYYFDKSGYTDFNLQIPTTLQDANALVEMYNRKYVITSKTTWTAYLDGGGIMKISMVFDEEIKTYVFSYLY